MCRGDPGPSGGWGNGDPNRPIGWVDTGKAAREAEERARRARERWGGGPGTGRDRGNGHKPRPPGPKPPWRGFFTRLPLHRGMTPFHLNNPRYHTPNCRYVAFMRRLHLA